jgi:hypothetical protein
MFFGGAVPLRRSDMLDLKATMASVTAKFNVYRTLIEGLGKQQMRHLIVSGDPGVGKSFEAEDVLTKFARTGRVRVCKSSGHMTPLALYNHLYTYRRANDINMFDDCDSVFQIKHTLNILKAATDTKPNRAITWESTSKKMLAPYYEFDGQVLLLTNIDMYADNCYETYRPLLDRVQYFRLELTPEEKVGRIVQVIFRKSPKPIHTDEVSAWLLMHYEKFGQYLSIRTAVKLLELAATSRDWQGIAQSTMFPNDGNSSQTKEL